MATKRSRQAKATWGGRRPGAGAPRGNLNGFKSGRFSPRVRAFHKAMEILPLTKDFLERYFVAEEAEQRLMSQALHHYADLIAVLPHSASLREVRLDGALLKRLILAGQSNQVIQRQMRRRRRRR